MKGFVPPPRYGGMQYSNEPMPITREITVTEGISVKDLAEKLDVRAKDLIATLLMGGVFVTVNQSLDAEMVKDVAAKFGAAATVITLRRGAGEPGHRRGSRRREDRHASRCRARRWSP